MTAQQVSTVTYSLVAAGTIEAKRAIARDATQAAAGGGAGVAILGFSDAKALTGEAFKVNVGPTAIAEAGAAIDGTVRTLKTNATGQLIPTASGTDVIAAILMPGQTATVAGEPIEVIPTIR